MWTQYNAAEPRSCSSLSTRAGQISKLTCWRFSINWRPSNKSLFWQQFLGWISKKLVPELWLRLMNWKTFKITKNSTVVVKYIYYSSINRWTQTLKFVELSISTVHHHPIQFISWLPLPAIPAVILNKTYGEIFITTLLAAAVLHAVDYCNKGNGGNCSIITLIQFRSSLYLIVWNKILE